MPKETAAPIEKEQLDVPDAAIEYAILGTLEDYIREENISPESRNQLIDLARDNFQMALEQGQPYGVALEFALDTCRGFEAPDRSHAEETAFFWQLALHDEGEMPTVDEIDRSMLKYDTTRDANSRAVGQELATTAGKAINVFVDESDDGEVAVDVAHVSSQAVDEVSARQAAEHAADATAASIDAERAASAAADAAEAQAASESHEATSDQELIDSISQLTAEINADKQSTSRARHERKPRIPDALRTPSWRRAIPDMDAEELQYNGKRRGKPVEHQSIITVGYDARNNEQFDAGIRDEAAADERGAMLFTTQDKTEYYLDRGHLLTRRLNEHNKYRDDGTALRVTAIRAGVGRPIELTYLDEQGKSVERTLEGDVTSATRLIPLQPERTTKPIDDSRVNRTLRRWSTLARRMDDALEKQA